jgi:hypothetical protein
MSILSIIGLVILLVGVFLIGFGLKATQSISNKVVEGLTGSYTNRTRWYLIGGVLLMLVGVILLFFIRTPSHPL